MRTTSLRSRLLLATVGLVALGLVAASAATYVLLSSSLLKRVDQQLIGAQPMAARGLFEVERGLPGPRPERFGPDALPVTYTQLLDPSGRVLVARSYGFGPVPSAPSLPAGLPGSSASTGALSRFMTVRSQDGAIRYRVLATALTSTEGTLVVAYPLQEVDSTLGRLLLVEGIVGALVLGVAGGLALFLVRLGFKPLVKMEHAAAEIAAGDLSRRVEPDDERTELGRLGRALNAMLAKIEAAFAERRASEARLRRFVADASHELRTPLTSIRGYAELFRRGAATRPEDLEKSMRRIEEESTRMSSLVEELLLLARLDQGRPLERVPVDLARVAADAVEDARAIQPERPIGVDANGGVMVGGDEARLRQVTANLLSNALTHTPARTPVHVSVGVDGAHAVLVVADEGPGLSAEEASKVFDRFFRADPARSREKGNVGLGLSIVSAIVETHGGHVALETSPGSGARFVVTIPLIRAEDAQDSQLSRRPTAG